MNFSDLIGLLGVTIILISYFLLQIDRLSSKSSMYSMLNLVGAIFLLISLYYNWNLPSVIIEIFWIAISVYGLVKNSKKAIAKL